MLDSIGWKSALVQADIATPGTVDLFLKTTHVKRTVGAHQVTACILLHKLLHEYYGEYQVSQQDNDVVPFEEWCKRRKFDNVQFYFWHYVLNTQLDIVVWDRTINACF